MNLLWPPEHEWVSPQCVHRLHDACHDPCPVCDSPCLCVCHRIRVPIHGYPVEKK